MKIINKIKNILFSIITFCSLAVAVRFILECANDFRSSIIFLLIIGIGGLSGILCLFLRIIKVIKSNSSLFYKYVGLLDICIGFTLLYILSVGRDMVSVGTITFVLINLTIGFYIFYDSFILSRKRN